MGIHILLWISFGILFYVFIGYPVLLSILSLLTKTTYTTSLPKGHVTLVISAFNEADSIADKLDNALETKYDPSKLQIIVVSDCSDDGTDDIVRSYSDRGVELLRMQSRGGKTLGLNAAVEAAQGEYIIFSDANAMYYTDAIPEMVKHFANENVGAVVGESTYVNEESSSQKQEGIYWKYETWIKRKESLSGSVVGGDGAIYGIRKALFSPMKASDLSDFVNPLHIVRQGFRCIYEPSAKSYENAGESYDKEYRRKVRIVNRAWRALWSNSDMLNFLKFGWFSWKLLSHKLLRWLAPFIMIVLFATNFVTVLSGNYVWLFVLQVLFYLVALVGRFVRSNDRIPSLVKVPYYFVLMNFAALHAIIEVYRGETYTTWSTARDKTL